MNKTKIQYLDWTWNPIKMRCTPVSAGCANCWHLAMAKRLAKNPSIYREEQKAYAGGSPMLDQKELEAPIHLRKSARIGVCFMGDLWHEKIEHFQIAQVWEVARHCQKHIFFFLTKRPNRLKSWTGVKSEVAHIPPIRGEIWPNNCWLGVSVEDQKTADERIPILLQISATHRWVSIEPMLGAVFLGRDWIDKPRYLETGTLDWIVLGGETGPKARPMHPDWVRSIRDQCQAVGMPFFFKSWGEWMPSLTFESGLATRWSAADNPQSKHFKMKGKLFDGDKPLFGGKAFESKMLNDGHETLMCRIGHKHSGHLLDGKEYLEMP